MDLGEYILKLSFAGITLGGIIIYLGRLIINKGSDLIIENQRNKMELARIDYQLKMSSLTEERAQIIKLIFQLLYKLELSLTTLTTTLQGPDWIDDKLRELEAEAALNETLQLLEENRIYFSQEHCNSIENVLMESRKVILNMKKAKLHEKNVKKNIESKRTDRNESDEESPLEIWRKAESSVKNNIRVLRMNLADTFRELIGVK